MRDMVCGGIAGCRRGRCGSIGGKMARLIDAEIVCHDLEFDGTEAMLVAAFDVTERHRAQEAARVAEEKYRAIFDMRWWESSSTRPDGRPIERQPGVREDARLRFSGGVAGGGIRCGGTAVCRTGADAGSGSGVGRKGNRAGRGGGALPEGSQPVLGDRESAGGARCEREIVLFEGTAEDITDRKAAEAQVNSLAYHDALTAAAEPNALHGPAGECAGRSAKKEREAGGAVSGSGPIQERQ